MKTANQILIAIVLLSFSITSCNGQVREPIKHLITKDGHIITLNVNTQEINNKNIEETCNFGQHDSIKNEDFTIIAKVGDNIIWEGNSLSSNEDIVNIKKIKIKRGTIIFDKDSLEDNRRVSGKVRYDTKDRPIYEYKLFFTVTHEGKEKQYHIDPKIQVNE
ncbi:MAG: hypothetical protein ABFR05_07425 [Bacteroidota bacterium]